MFELTDGEHDHVVLVGWVLQSDPESPDGPVQVLKCGTMGVEYPGDCRPLLEALTTPCPISVIAERLGEQGADEKEVVDFLAVCDLRVIPQGPLAALQAFQGITVRPLGDVVLLDDLLEFAEVYREPGEDPITVSIVLAGALLESLPGEDLPTFAERINEHLDYAPEQLARAALTDLTELLESGYVRLEVAG